MLKWLQLLEKEHDLRLTVCVLQLYADLQPLPLMMMMLIRRLTVLLDQD